MLIRYALRALQTSRSCRCRYTQISRPSHLLFPVFLYSFFHSDTKPDYNKKNMVKQKTVHTRALSTYNARCTRAISLAFYKRNKKLHPRALLSYISTWEFLRTLEKCANHSAAPRASLCTSLVFLKIPVCLYNSTMHSDAFFISLTYSQLHGAHSNY